MIFEAFSRFLLYLASYNPMEINPSPSKVAMPHSYSLDSWINDTVAIENPYFAYANNEESDDDTFVDYQALITLPICCNSIDPEVNSITHTCSTSGKFAQRNQSSPLELYLPPHLGGRWYPILHLFPSENRSHYKFEVRRPRCDNSLKEIKLSMDEFEVGSQGRFLRNGYFGYNNDEFYSPQEYCISALTGEFVQVMVCESHCSFSEGRPCIQKCCNPDEIYSFSRRSCIKSKGALFRPIFYHDLSTKLSDSEEESVQPHYHIAFPRSFKYHCMENRTQILPAGADFASALSNFTNRKYYSAHFKIRKDGRIMYRKDGKAIVLPEGYPLYLQEENKKCYTLKSSAHYCIDGAAEYGSPNPFNNDPGEIFLVTCPEYLEELPKIGPLSSVYGNVMITSSVFSLFTAFVYLALRDKIKTAKIIASYAFSMFLMYIFLGLAHLIRYYNGNDVLKTASCVTIGIASHLFSLSSTTWLTLMNLDIWWTFRKFRPLQRGVQVRHFLTYSVFGWGVPLFITGISTFLHFRYEEASEDNCAVVGVPLPAYGRESCEIKQLSLGVYLYYPAAVLLGFNLLFFIVTTYTLCRHSRETQMATARKNQNHHHQVFLFAKLFFVMGVSRGFEILTWLGSGPTLTWYWALFDIFNVLQAVAIFIIYVCKRDVLGSLKELLFRCYYGHKGNGPRNGPLGQRRSHTIRVSTVSQQRDNATVAMPLIISGRSSLKCVK